MIKGKIRYLNNLKLCLGLGALKGEEYLEGLLEKVKLVREIFVMEVGRGSEVFIPKELRVSHLPASMHFYDPVIGYILNLIDQESRARLSDVQILAKELHSDAAFMDKIKQIFRGNNEKIILKRELLSKSFALGPDYAKNHHCRDIQMSRIVGVEQSLSLADFRGVNNTKY